MFSAALVLVLILVLWAEFVNGWTDAPNAIATVVSTRVLSPGKAVVMAGVSEYGGGDVRDGGRRHHRNGDREI